MSLDKLKPASQADIIAYAPYYKGDKRTILPFAMSLYQKGSLEGERLIEEADGIPFVATWYVSKLPAELTRCRLQFDGNAELSYELMMANSEFIDYLIDILRKYKATRKEAKPVIDFSRAFYRKLLKIDE